jgi:hypothetical protein
VILGAIIGIGGIGGVALFGSLIATLFGQVGQGWKGEDVDMSAADRLVDHMGQDAELRRDMENFDNGLSPYVEPPPTPPPPPVPSDPFAYSAAHHLGDNWASGTAGGYPLINEGLSYTINFDLTQEMIDWANYANDGKLRISFDAGGAGHARIHNDNVNRVLLDGHQLGTARNGHNVFHYDISNATPHRMSLTFTSGLLWGNEYDDYDFSNLTIQ